MVFSSATMDVMELYGCEMGVMVFYGGECKVDVNGKFDETPTDFNGILGNKYAFKINMDEWQSMKLSPSLTFHNVFGDPQIINVLMPMVTPLKGETNDAAMKDTIVLLDLACVTDDDVTPS
ncbi:hypothetical protein Tco_1023754 [Tanacetum coccineum]